MTESTNLKQLYNIVDWIDLGLVIAIVAYYSRSDLTQLLDLSSANATPIGILLLLASLAICVTFILLTIKMRKRQEVSLARATARIIWNTIWIPLDLYFLYTLLIA